ncbi:MAG: hypothetical protein G01um101444_169 [Parcubacteria group bacterium Gr01-1014_44]|nr:MAG: hypothetical protein G01um101444_169 [Parcubacteria group bacterium Gr01-1014_44]
MFKTMRLLIITQKVDQEDDVLGFFIGWIKEFSKRFEKVTVICLKAGHYDLPLNVKVLSLGKEKDLPKLGRLFNFYKYIWQERKSYDAVFIHMNPKYVPLGWPVWRMLGKTISLWYAHGHVPPMLRIADRLTDIAFASTKEGYRLNSSKLKIVGQGIDVEKFHPIVKPQTETFRIVTVGRISPSKDYETLINAATLLTNPERDREGSQRASVSYGTKDHKLAIKIIGDIAYQKQQVYLDGLKNLVNEKELTSVIKFTGPVANKDLPPLLQEADLFVNMGHTGSLDKTVLEAMACGLPILTCNEAYEKVLGEYGELLMYPKKDFIELAKKIGSMINVGIDERVRIGQDLRAIVVRDHNLPGLINKIAGVLNA